MSPDRTDTLHNRHRSPDGFGTKVKRMLWAATEATAFRYTWPTWYRYRAWLLRRFGAEIHPTARIRRTCRIVCPWNLRVGANTATGEEVWFYCLGPVTLGDRVTVSHFAHLCAGSHDYSDTLRMVLTRPPITVGDDVWIAADAFVGPGVALGEGSILGARAAAFRDCADWQVYGGNPAVVIAERPRPAL